MAAVSVERAFQAALGGGCQTAFAAHVAEGQLHLFHEACGIRQATLTPADFAAPTATADRLLRAWGLRS
jgi:hydroxymethylbilane synthase